MIAIGFGFIALVVGCYILAVVVGTSESKVQGDRGVEQGGA